MSVLYFFFQLKDHEKPEKRDVAKYFQLKRQFFAPYHCYYYFWTFLNQYFEGETKLEPREPSHAVHPFLLFLSVFCSGERLSSSRCAFGLVSSTLRSLDAPQTVWSWDRFFGCKGVFSFPAAAVAETDTLRSEEPPTAVWTPRNSSSEVVELCGWAPRVGGERGSRGSRGWSEGRSLQFVPRVCMMSSPVWFKVLSHHRVSLNERFEEYCFGNFSETAKFKKK